MLPCFKEASQLDLVHLLVPEIDESFVAALREAAASYLAFSGNEVIVHSLPETDILSEILSQAESLMFSSHTVAKELRSLGFILFGLAGTFVSVALSR